MRAAVDSKDAVEHKETHVDSKRVDAIAAALDEQHRKLQADANALLDVWTEDKSSADTEVDMPVVSANTDVEIKAMDDTLELDLSDLDDVRDVSGEPTPPPIPPAAFDVAPRSSGDGGGGRGSGEPPRGPRVPERRRTEVLEGRISALNAALQKVIDHAENWPQTAEEKKEQKKLKKWLKSGGKGDWPVSDTLTAANYRTVLRKTGVPAHVLGLLRSSNLRAGDSPFSFISRELSAHQSELAQSESAEFDLDLAELEGAIESSVSGSRMELSDAGDDYPELSEDKKMARLRELWDLHGIDGDESMGVGSMRVGEEVRVRADSGDLLTGVLVHVKLDGSKAAVAMPDESLVVASKEDLLEWNGQDIAPPAGELEPDAFEQETEEEGHDTQEVEIPPTTAEEREDENYEVLAEDRTTWFNLKLTKQGDQHFLWFESVTDPDSAKAVVLDKGLFGSAEKAIERAHAILEDYRFFTQQELMHLIYADLQGSSAYFKQELKKISEAEDYDKETKELAAIGDVKVVRSWDEQEHTYSVEVVVPHSKSKAQFLVKRDRSEDELAADLVSLAGNSESAWPENLKSVAQVISERLGISQEEFIAALRGERSDVPADAPDESGAGEKSEDDVNADDALSAMDEFLGDSTEDESDEKAIEIETEIDPELEKFGNFVGVAANKEWDLKNKEKEKGKVMALQLHPFFIAMGEGGVDMAGFRDILDSVHADKLMWESKGARPFIARKQAIDSAINAFSQEVKNAIKEEVEEEAGRQGRVAEKLGKPGVVLMRFTPERMLGQWYDEYERYLGSEPEESDVQETQESQQDVQKEEEVEVSEEIQERLKVWNEWLEGLKNTSSGMRKAVEAVDWSFLTEAIENNDADISEMMNKTRDILRFVRTQADTDALRATLGQIDLRLGHKKDAQRGYRVLIPEIGKRFNAKTMEISRTDSSSFPAGTVLAIDGIGIQMPNGEIMAGGKMRVATAQ